MLKADSLLEHGTPRSMLLQPHVPYSNPVSMVMIRETPSQVDATSVRQWT